MITEAVSGVYRSLARYWRERVDDPKARPGGVDDELRAMEAAWSTALGYQITAQRLKAIMDSAAEGSGSDQVSLFLDVRERDPLLEAHLGTRRLAVTGAPWQLTSEAQPKRAAELTQILTNARIGGLIAHLADAVPTGYAGAVTDWEEGGRGIRGWVPIHPTAFEFDEAGNPAVTTMTGGVKALQDFGPAQIVYVRANARPGLPTRSGLLRTLIWHWFFKHTNMRNWNRYLEKFGMPLVVGKVPDSTFNDTVKRNALLSALKKMATDSAGLVTESTALEFAKGLDTGSVDAYERLSRYVDELMTLLVLGQLATSQAGSGLSQGGMQESVRQDIAAADSAMLSEAIMAGVVAPLARFRYGDVGDLTFAIDASPAKDLKSWAETYKILTEVTGRKMDPDTIASEFDVVFQDAQEPEAPPSTALVDLADRTKLPPAETALDSIVTEALRLTVDDPEVLAAWLGPVTAEIRRAFKGIDPDDPGALAAFRDRIPGLVGRLPGLLQDMDSTEFERHLSGAMLAAALNGYVAPVGA
jgi:phage gp29-like protein